MNAVLPALACAAVVTAVATGEARCQPSTCGPSTACDSYFMDRVEIELAKPLEPEVAGALRSVKRGSPWRPLGDLLRKIEGARLRPSVPWHLAKKLGLTRSYTLRMRPTPGLTKARLSGIVAALQALGPDVVARAAPVPLPSPPAEDPFVGDAEVVPYSPERPCGTQWYLHRSGVPEAWDCGATGSGVIVAVVDWGFELDHVEMTGAFDPSRNYNACVKKSVILDNTKSFHGTGTAGQIAARRDSRGIQGIAHAATIWPIQAACSSDKRLACDESWNDDENPWAVAIAQVADWAPADRRVVILLEVQTCCKGSYEGSIAVDEAIGAAIDKGIVVVIAAGNGDRDAGCDDSGNPIEPSGAIVVGATTYDDGNPRYSGSNYGTRIVVSAPGDPDYDPTITTKDRKCDPGQADDAAYAKEFGGTSGAAAKVAGVVALMLEKSPMLTPKEVADILVKVGTPVPHDPEKPAGVFLNAEGAVAAADPKGCNRE